MTVARNHAPPSLVMPRKLCLKLVRLVLSSLIQIFLGVNPPYLMNNFDCADTLADFEQLPTYLVYEIDPNEIRMSQVFPFGSLDRHEVRKLLYLPVELGSSDFGRRQRSCRSIPKGNYIASATLADLRIRQAKRTPRPRSLESVLDLPHELLLEIFESLHPIDLYHLIRTTKFLRRFLLDRSSSPVWEKAFLQHSNVLFPPTDVSFPKWASLLFGPATCDKCGYPNVLVDFAYRKRICQICMTANYKSKSYIKGLVTQAFSFYPVARNDFWRLVRYTYRSSSFFYPHIYHYQRKPFYLEEDARERIQEMKAFLLAIDAGHADAQVDYWAFTHKTALAARNHNKHAVACSKWAEGQFLKLENEFELLLGKFLDICRKRLLALGYDQRDVANAHDMYSYLHANCKRTNPSRFARKDYRHHLPALENMVTFAKNGRLAVEREQRVEARRNQVSSFYQNTKAHIDPVHWQHLPELSDVQGVSLFADYIRVDPEPLEEKHIPVDAGRSAVLVFVDKWIREAQAYLRGILETAGLNTTRVSQGDVLNLATAVFLCRPYAPKSFEWSRCPVLIGWDAVGPHFYCTESQKYTDRPSTYEQSFQFCESGYHAVIQLLGLLNLDPLVTTAQDLDELNRRFICNTEAPNVPVMTWRECVNRASQMQSLDANLPTLTFSILTEEATQSILFRETSYPHPGHRVWSCRRCTQYLDTPSTRQDVIAHLESRHQISIRPVENIDFFYRQRRIPSERKKIVIPREDGASHCCARCKHPSNLRIRDQIAVLQHLKDKHKVPEPKEGVDFHVISVVKKGETQTIDSIS